MISGFHTGDLNPIWTVPMLGTHNTVVDNRLPAPSRNDPHDCNLQSCCGVALPVAGATPRRSAFPSHS